MTLHPKQVRTETTVMDCKARSPSGLISSWSFLWKGYRSGDAGYAQSFGGMAPLVKSSANFRKRAAVEGVWAASRISSNVHLSMWAADSFGIPEKASVTVFKGMHLAGGFFCGAWAGMCACRAFGVSLEGKLEAISGSESRPYEKVSLQALPTAPAPTGIGAFAVFEKELVEEEMDEALASFVTRLA